MFRWTLALIAIVTLTGGASAQSAVERGNYLVNGILTCGNCHSPKGPGGVVGRNADRPMSEADTRDPVKKGFCLVTIGHCRECHTPMERGQRLFATRYGAGGFRFEGPFGESFSRNITSHKEKGIGAWSDA